VISRFYIGVVPGVSAAYGGPVASRCDRTPTDHSERCKAMPCLVNQRREAPIPVSATWSLRSDLTLGPLPSAVPCARAHAVACLWEWGMSGAGDTVALVVSELITNSVAASRALDGGPFPVLLRMLSAARS